MKLIEIKLILSLRRAKKLLTLCIHFFGRLKYKLQSSEFLMIIIIRAFLFVIKTIYIYIPTISVF